MENKRVHLIIKGYVQGVFFRASTRDIANSFGLTGWVRNMPDGNVEVVFEGAEEQVQKAVKWCHKGPYGATVTDVEETWSESTCEFKSFEIKYR